MGYSFGGDSSGGSSSMASMAMGGSLIALEARAKGSAPEVDESLLKNGKLDQSEMSARVHEALIKKSEAGTLGKEKTGENEEHVSNNEEGMIAENFDDFIKKVAETASRENGEEVTVENFENYVKEMMESISRGNGEGAADDFKDYVKKILSLSQQTDQNLKADVKVVEEVNESFAKEKQEAIKFAWSVWLQSSLEQLGGSLKTLAEASKEIDAAVEQATLPDMSAGAL